MARIAFLGNFSIFYCSEVQYKAELESMGHEVDAIQETSTYGEEILGRGLKADMLVWVHSHGVNIPGMNMKLVLQTLREANIPSLAWHLDLYMPLERWKEYENSPYMKVDHFFTVDKLMADWFNKNTSTKGHFLPAGIFSQQAYIEDYSPSCSSDVTFVGSKNYGHKEWSYRKRLVDWLESTYGDRFVHWGGDGKKLMRGDDMNKVYASTRVAVGDTLCVGFDYPYYFSDRLFNSIGTGAFTIHPYIKGLEGLFEIDKEVVTYEFGNFGQLKGKIDYYLSHPKERNDIRIAGYMRTKRDHTYLSRWRTILETVGLAK